MNIANTIKQHRYESICLALCLILLLALYPAARLGSQARANAKEDQDLNVNLVRLQRAGTRGAVANPSLVKAQQGLAQLVRVEAEKSIDLFTQKNQRSFLMPGFFPEADEAARWNFRPEYKKAIKALYEQTLRAHWPSYDAKKDVSEIGVYIDLDAGDGFPIGLWAEDKGMPDVEDCWFGQLSLWVQQDVAEVVRKLNHRSAQDQGEQPNIANAAVKRIISVDVDTYYYIGSTDETQQAPPVLDGPRRGPAGLPGFPQPGMGPEMMPFGGGAAVQPRAHITSARERAEKKLRKRVEVTPFTEHISDENADVLHFSISLIIDSRRVNEFLEELSRKNLYSILSVNLSREDVPIDTKEFPRLSNKFESFSPSEHIADDLFYGGDPVVRLDIEAEAIFLKDVYGQSMPEEVKSVLQNKQTLVKRQLEAVEDERERRRKAQEKAAKKKERQSRKKKKK